jgi:hypothetical protein
MKADEIYVEDQRLFTRVLIDGITGLAQVDTGANHSFLHENSVKYFQQVKESFGSASGAIESGIKVQKYTIKSLEFIGQNYENLTLNYFGGHKILTNIQYPVLLTVGTDILFRSDKALCLDPYMNRLTFTTFNTASSNDFINFTEIEFCSGLAVFGMKLGRHELRAVFDTGAGYSVLNSTSLTRLKNDTESLGYEDITDPFGNSSKAPLLLHPDAKISDINFGAVKMLCMNLSAVESALGSRIDLVLGLDTIIKHKWLVDVNRSRLYFTPFEIEK